MEQTIISCGDVLDISAVSQKHAELKSALEGNQAIALCAAELQRIDGAGLQLLVAFFKEAEKLHIDVKWNETSESLLRAASVLGVSSHIHLN